MHIFTLKVNFEKTFHLNIYIYYHHNFQVSYNAILSGKTVTFVVLLISHRLVLLKCLSRGMVLNWDIQVSKIDKKISEGQTRYFSVGRWWASIINRHNIFFVSIGFKTWIERRPNSNWIVWISLVWFASHVEDWQEKKIMLNLSLSVCFGKKDTQG